MQDVCHFMACSMDCVLQLLNLYGTLGRAVFKEFLKTKPPRDNHSDVTGEVTNVDGAVVTKDRKVSMN